MLDEIVLAEGLAVIGDDTSSLLYAGRWFPVRSTTTIASKLQIFVFILPCCRNSGWNISKARAVTVALR